MTAPLSTGLVRRSARRPARGAAVGEGPPRAESVLVHRRDLGLREGRRRDRGVRDRRRREGARTRAPELRGFGLRSRDRRARRRRRVQGARALRASAAETSISSSSIRRRSRARRRAAASRGARCATYAELIGAALEVTAPGGLLVAASSTHKMTLGRVRARARRRRALGAHALASDRSPVAAARFSDDPGLSREQLPQVRRGRSRMISRRAALPCVDRRRAGCASCSCGRRMRNRPRCPTASSGRRKHTRTRVRSRRV